MYDFKVASSRARPNLIIIAIVATKRSESFKHYGCISQYQKFFLFSCRICNITDNGAFIYACNALAVTTLVTKQKLGVSGC